MSYPVRRKKCPVEIVHITSLQNRWHCFRHEENVYQTDAEVKDCTHDPWICLMNVHKMYLMNVSPLPNHQFCVVHPLARCWLKKMEQTVKKMEQTVKVSFDYGIAIISHLSRALYCRYCHVDEIVWQISFGFGSSNIPWSSNIRMDSTPEINICCSPYLAISKSHEIFCPKQIRHPPHLQAVSYLIQI